MGIDLRLESIKPSRVLRIGRGKDKGTKFYAEDICSLRLSFLFNVFFMLLFREFATAEL